MNIVVLSHRLPFPPDKGEKIRTYNQLEYLRKQACEVTLFCTVASQEEMALADEYERKTGVSVVAVRGSYRKPAMLLGILKGRALTVSHFYSRLLQKKFNEFVDGKPVDVIYCTSSAMAEYVFKGQPTVRDSDSKRLDLIDFMDLDSDKWRQYREVSSFPMSLVYLYEEVTLGHYESRIQKRFDECIFISCNETTLFKKKLGNTPKNVQVVGNGVDMDAFRPPDISRPVSGKTLFFSGVMDYLPNVNAMLWFVKYVWPGLTRIQPDVRLVIAGMNPSKEILDIAIDDRIVVTGYVEDMLSFYHDANIFVAPFQIARGVQNKILQAFACGLPVVSTSAGVEGINCIDGKHYLQASDPEEFIQQINRLIDDQSSYSTIASNALDLVNSHFTWDASNRQLFELFSSSGTV